MKKPRGRPTTIKFKDMSPEERRAYERVTSAKYRRSKYVPIKRTIDFGDIRQCKTCEQKFPRTKEFFYANRSMRSGFSTICKTCSIKHSRRWALRNTFGGTPEEYDALMAKSSCAICGTTRLLRLDHCHDKNHVRGVLCNTCNTTLGVFADDAERFRAAAVYLERDREAPGSNLAT